MGFCSNGAKPYPPTLSSAGTRRRQAAARSRPRGAKWTRLEVVGGPRPSLSMPQLEYNRAGRLLLSPAFLRRAEEGRGRVESVHLSAGNLKTFGKSLADHARALTFKALTL